MIAAIGAIAGFLSTVAPLLVQWLTLKENNSHAREMEQLRQQGEREKIAGQVDIENSRVDARQAEHIYDFASGASGVRWVDALAVFIRPFITLSFFVLYLLMKVGLFIYAVNSGYDLGQLVKLIWSEADEAVFGAIMGFWFGNRVIMRTQGMAATQAIMQKGTKL
jgi:hypothetical protein